MGYVESGDISTCDEATSPRPLLYGLKNKLLTGVAGALQSNKGERKNAFA
jgi:hypothetical protein